MLKILKNISKSDQKLSNFYPGLIQKFKKCQKNDKNWSKIQKLKKIQKLIKNSKIEKIKKFKNLKNTSNSVYVVLIPRKYLKVQKWSKKLIK